MFGTLKRWLFLKAVAELKKQKKTNRQSRQNAMHHICILYEYSNENDVSAVKKLIHHFRNQGKKVQSLAFVNTKEKLNDFISLQYISKEIGVNQVPKSPDVQQFTDLESDVLIVLCHHFYDHLRYITLAHQSLLKTGLHFPKGESYFDLMIDISPDLPYQKMIDSIHQSIHILSKT